MLCLLRLSCRMVLQSSGAGGLGSAAPSPDPRPRAPRQSFPPMMLGVLTAGGDPVDFQNVPSQQTEGVNETGPNLKCYKEQAACFADTVPKPMVLEQGSHYFSPGLERAGCLYCFPASEVPNKDDFWFKVGAMTVYMTSLFLT